MTKEVCRECAKRGIPVVLTESGTLGEIVYPSIREIKVIYATPEEKAAGYPTERLAVVLTDRCGHSFTNALPRQLRLPTQDELMEAIPDAATLEEVDAMLDYLKFADKEENGHGISENT